MESEKDVKKKSKQVLGEHSDAAVGRKLSQPFPNGIGDKIRQTSLNKVTEELLSDEGFAEDSTIDRPEKSELSVSERRMSHKQARQQANYVNVEVDRRNAAKSSLLEAQNYSKKSQSHSENVTAGLNAIEKHFAFAGPNKKITSKNLKQHSANHKRGINQQHYENYKLPEQIQTKPLQTGRDYASGGSNSNFPSYESNHVSPGSSSQIMYSGPQIKVNSSKVSKNVQELDENLKEDPTRIRALQRKTGEDVTGKTFYGTSKFPL